MILSETPRRIMVTKLVTWGHWFALSNILIALVIAAVYVFASPLPETLLGIVFLLVNWLSHIGFLTFFGFVIFVLPLIYALPRSRVIRGAGSTIAAIGLALLAFDALLYTKYGLHLSFGSADLIKSETQTVINAFGWQQWGFLLLLFVVWLGFQLVLANALWKRIERFQRFRLGIPISSVFVTCFVSSHALHVWADANLYHPILQQDNLFPLSYPATAKTLMSKYGLLDLDSYKQRKALQFESGIKGINYPTNPVYCSIDNNQQLVLLLQTDKGQINTKGSTLVRFEDHYDLSSNDPSARLTSLFGLPEIYLPQLAQKTPLVLELPEKLGLPVWLYSDNPISHQGIQRFSVSLTVFKQKLNQDNAKLAIGFMPTAQINQLLQDGLLNTNQVIISALTMDRDDIHPVAMYSNLTLGNSLSSHLDFASTLLSQIGCNAPSDDYSVGQAMQSPRRNWLVGTKGSKVIVMHNGNRIEVLSNGNYKIFDRQTGEESTEALNTGLLGQAIKHLTRFTQ
ncbi:DUF3413 domain-containing protein [Aliiglaciecola sp. LCG003]|uniref:DUF3413 domain-containing protein n=1 Tax=Aliiglaciecola sp. LCG003 TaxID=3053655 RepID=UPI002572BA4F|nr:DUF3413 domain-containing protein [Aliiglaciecola sp. LCG003]WJG10983.1 DUF3413 domain-containing protein [Aliiglaciecola sp. LCG003]